MNKPLIAIAAAAVALQGCANQAPHSLVSPNLFNEGIAKTCTPSTVDINAAAPSGTIAMTNDGWCGVSASEKDGQAFLLGLVRTRPEHGRVLIQKVNSATRIEYTPENRYVGADRFTVALRSHTPSVPDTTVQVVVNVTMGEGMAAPAPAPAPAPTRRSTTPRRTH